jgi:STE24 endopeptidase
MSILEMPQKWREHDQRVKPYVWSHRALGWGRSVLGLALLAYLYLGGAFGSLELAIASLIKNRFLIWLGYFGILAVGWEGLTFPFSVGHHLLEKKYGLSKQSYPSWLWDKAKGLGLGAVLGTLVFGFLYLSIQWFGSYWWAAAATFLVSFSIVLAQLAPVLLIPIFFKLKPMAEGPLKERLLNLCTRYGVEVKDVYHLGLGEKTEKGNAAFVGLGKTKRILIGDTLYEKYQPEEVEAVFAHELGHQVHNDLWKGIFFSAFWIYFSFFLADKLAQAFRPPLGPESLLNPSHVLVFFIALSLIQLPIGVVQAGFSRYRERMADEFAAGKTGSGLLLAQALEKLTFQNYSLFHPHPVLEFLQHSHPAPWRRIVRLRDRD